MKLKLALLATLLASLMASCVVVPAHSYYGHGDRGYHYHDGGDRGGHGGWRR